MSQKRHTVDQIIAKLRRADVELGKGRKVPEVCKLLGRPRSVAARTCSTFETGGEGGLNIWQTAPY